MSSSIEPLDAAALRWRCDPQALPFDSTESVEPLPGVIGQPLALEALQFGVETDAPGQNVYVRGITGSGRMRMVQRLLAELDPRQGPTLDRCYVANFSQPDRPRLVSLAPGRANAFRRRVRDLADFIADDLNDGLNSETLQASRQALQEQAQAKIREIMAPFEQELAEQDLALVQIKAGQLPQPAIFPIIEGKPVSAEQLEQLLQAGELSAEAKQALVDKVQEASKRLPAITLEVTRAHQAGARELQAFNEKAIRKLLGDVSRTISEEFANDAVDHFLREVIDDVVDYSFSGNEKPLDPRRRYAVNVLLQAGEPEKASPVVVENAPSVVNLLGTVETQWSERGPRRSDHMDIKAGALLRADGGYLVLDAMEILRQPSAWPLLMRTLRTGVLEIVPPELAYPYAPISLKPEPIPITVRVIMIGSGGLYHRLDRGDPDFADQFKVLADFAGVIDRGQEAVIQYAGVLARLVADEQLPHFEASAVAALAEHGARIAANGRRLTTRFGRVADLAREAAYLARRDSEADLVTGDHVRRAVRRTKARASLPSTRFQSLIQDGTINIETTGAVVGQVNGLAVINAGPIVYGFPARITATIGAGSSGIIDIEGRAAMGGAIHTKGFHILGGLLRHLLATDHPLTFSASLAFEQSYGGIDGDSASGAEMCCLLSALTEIPIHQGLAMTGAIDQHGRVQAIGGANEKIEGFFDTCAHSGLTGEQGVLIPRANADDLMLRHDVVDACREGRFHVYAVATIQDALTLLTGTPAGEREGERYPEGTVLHEAVRKAEEFWQESGGSGRRKSAPPPGDEPAEGS